jgi:predicted ATPase
MLYEVRSDLKNSRELAERLHALAQSAQDQDQLLQAHMALAITSFSLGDLVATRQHSLQAVALYDPQRHRVHSDLYGQDPKVACLAFAAVSLWLLGYPDQARNHIHEALVLSEELGHPTTRTLALYFATMLWQYCRETTAVQECAGATTAIATEHGLSLWLANSLIMSGWAEAEQGACTKGITMLREGLTNWDATGAQTHRTYFLGLLADALSRAGKHEEGLSVLNEALALMQSAGSFFHGAELHRLYGELLLRHPADKPVWDDAEVCFQRALAMARQQQAKSLELRAATSLARLYATHNRQVEARSVLQQCYNWFTEGFDTPDLQEARALLEQSA